MELTGRAAGRPAREGATLSLKGMTLLAAFAVGGCVVQSPGHLYPIDGPLAARTPIPIDPVSLSGVATSGTLSAVLEDGEICRGCWAAVRKDDPTAGALSGDGDRVYGQGFFVAHVLGSTVFARAVLTGARGTALRTEFYDPTPGDASHLVGIARDGSGNVFKLTF